MESNYSSIISTLKLINNQLNAKFENYPNSTYNHTRCRILNLLVDGQQCSQRDIQKKMNIDGAAITRHLKVLEENGDITRSRSAHDQRENRIKITDQGKLAITTCNIYQNQLYTKLFENFDENQIATLSHNLKKLQSNLNDK